MVMLPGRDHNYNVSDTRPWYQVVWGAFSQKRGYQQGRIGFLGRQHLSIVDYLEITTGSDTAEILEVAIIYMYIIAIYIYNRHLRSVCFSNTDK